MQPLCPNCGDPIEPGEIYCDKCGTKVGQDTPVQDQYPGQTPNAYQNQYQTPTPNVYQNQYQTPAPNPYQNQYQAPTPNAFQGQQQIPAPNQYQAQTPNINQSQYSYMPGQQQNIPPYPPPYSQPKKPGTSKKLVKIVFISVSIIAIIIVALGIIGTLSQKSKKSDNTKPTVSDSSKPNTDANKPNNDTSNNGNTNNNGNNNNTTSSNKKQATWSTNMNASARYEESERKVYVDYTATLKNSGNVDAQNINLYFNPKSNDENAKYLSIEPKTLINYDGIVDQIKAGSSYEIESTFYYSNIDSYDATDEILDDICEKFVNVPLLVEWQENGKSYTVNLVITE